MRRLNNNIRIFSGNATPDLAHKICDAPLPAPGQALVSTFSDGEIRVEIADNVRGGMSSSSSQPARRRIIT